MDIYGVPGKNEEVPKSGTNGVFLTNELYTQK